MARRAAGIGDAEVKVLGHSQGFAMGGPRSLEKRARRLDMSDVLGQEAMLCRARSNVCGLLSDVFEGCDSWVEWARR